MVSDDILDVLPVLSCNRIIHEAKNYIYITNIKEMILKTSTKYVLLRWDSILSGNHPKI